MTLLEVCRKFAQPREAILYLLASLAVSALGFATPALTAIIFDRIVPVGERRILVEALLMMLVVITSSQLFEFFAAFLRLRLQARVSHGMRALFMERLLSLPPEFFRRFTVGDLLARAGMTDGEQEWFLISIFTGFFSALFSISSLVILFSLDTRIGLVSLIAGACVLGVAGWVGWRKLRLDRSLLQSASGLHSFLLQLFVGISKVRSAGAEFWLFSRWAERFREKQRLGLASARVSGLSAAFYSILPLACMAVFFLLLGKDTPLGRLSPGRYLAAFTAFTLFMNGILRLAAAISDLAGVVPLFERAQPVLTAMPEKSTRGTRTIRLKGRVELKNLSFRYAPGDPLVLEDLSFRIEPGQFVACVGPSGSGKSTLIRLLLGFEKPSSGQILYDGVSLSELDVLDLRRQLGTILQHDSLLTGNIYENIAAVRAIPLKEAWEAARLAGIEKEIARLPMGMHSFVTPGGRAFSGGERQRFIIARAVAGQPRLLIFDEATSALDNQVQEEVMRNLAGLQLTRLVVAHRLSTVRNADLILVFERGRLVERGDFTSLLSQGGVFARLAHRQAV